MTSQPVQQTTTIPILAIISRSKGSQTMTFCQVREYLSSKNHAENGAWRLLPDLFFEKALFEVRASGL